MEYLPADWLTDIQKRLIEIKLSDLNITYKEWIKKAHDELELNINSKSLVRFIIRTALGYPWNPMDKGGRFTFLNPCDMETLKQECYEICNSEPRYINIADFLDLAIELKTNRIMNAYKFMIFIGSTTLAANLQEEELDTEPSREWV